MLGNSQKRNIQIANNYSDSVVIRAIIKLKQQHGISDP